MLLLYPGELYRLLGASSFIECSLQINMFCNLVVPLHWYKKKSGMFQKLCKILENYWENNRQLCSKVSTFRNTYWSFCIERLAKNIQPWSKRVLTDFIQSCYFFYFLQVRNLPGVVDDYRQNSRLVTLEMYIWRFCTLFGWMCSIFVNGESLDLYKYNRKLTKDTRRVWRYQRGNQNPYIEEGQTTQWPKEKVQKDKQRSTKHTYKTKDRVTRTPLKTGCELRYSGRVSSSCSTRDTRRVNLVTNPVITHERGKYIAVNRKTFKLFKCLLLRNYKYD